jgi:hypothetical protein
MSIRTEIQKIETKLRTVFNKDKITSYDVIECNRLIDIWKQLTGFDIDKHVKSNEESIIDDDPYWQIKN